MINVSCYSALYLLFTFVYFLLGGRTAEGKKEIYNVLNYSTPEGRMTVGILAFALLFVAIPSVYGIFWALALLRPVPAHLRPRLDEPLDCSSDCFGRKTSKDRAHSLKHDQNKTNESTPKNTPKQQQQQKKTKNSQ